MSEFSWKRDCGLALLLAFIKIEMNYSWDSLIIK